MNLLNLLTQLVMLLNLQFTLRTFLQITSELKEIVYYSKRPVTRASKMAECNKIVSSASIENSDHKTDSVVNKKEKSSFLFYSENNFTWKGDLKSL